MNRDNRVFYEMVCRIEGIEPSADVLERLEPRRRPDSASAQPTLRLVHSTETVTKRKRRKRLHLRVIDGDRE